MFISYYFATISTASVPRKKTSKQGNQKKKKKKLLRITRQPRASIKKQIMVTVKLVFKKINNYLPQKKTESAEPEPKVGLSTRLVQQLSKYSKLFKETTNRST